MGASEHPAWIRAVEGRATVHQFGRSSGRIVPPNYPIWEGDRLLLGREARLEVAFHDGSLMRLGPGTELMVRRLTDERVQVHLISGALALQSEFPERYELFTSSTYLYPAEEGHYYLSREAGREVAQVLEGRARVAYRGRAWNLLPGEGLFDGSLSVGGLDSSERSLIRWRPSGSGIDAISDPSSDGGSLPYGGGLELNLYGNWGRVAGYGRVWWPRVDSTWTPYREGRWVHHPRKGRVWISQAPWGWLPDHYGDWVFVPQNSRWCWVPGNLGRWSPAGSGLRFRNRSRPTAGFITLSPTPGTRKKSTEPTDPWIRRRSRVPPNPVPATRFFHHPTPERDSQLEVRTGRLALPSQRLGPPSRRLDPSSRLSHGRRNPSSLKAPVPRARRPVPSRVRDFNRSRRP